MTKKEFIEKMKDMPDDSEVYFWDFGKCAWKICSPYYICNGYEGTTDGKMIGNFIGIE